MKLVVEGCRHARLQVWSHDRVTAVVRAVCTTCYNRFRIDEEDLLEAPGADRLVWNLDKAPWRPDTPSPPCVHDLKVPVMSVGVPKGFQDALCLGCGSVLRHPEQRGSWEEVVFSGFLIAEPP